MLPAFDNWQSATRFSALILLLLVLPILLDAVGRPQRVEVYNSLRVGDGPYVKTRQQLFGTFDDIDIAFIGSSVLGMAVNVDYVQEQMAKRFDGDVSVRMFGFAFQGFDLQYVMIRDLLEHRRVKMLVTTFSGPEELRDQPHVQLHRLARYGDYPDVFQGLDWFDRAAVYGSYVLDGPRQTLTWLRHDKPVEQDERRSFMAYEDPPAQFGPPAQAIVLTDDTRAEFFLSESNLSARQHHFVTAISQLADSYKVPLVIVNLPTPEDIGRGKIWERADWRRVMATPPAVIGFRRSELLPENATTSFFKDSIHLNAEGQDRLTRSITPYLIDHYAEIRKIR